MKDGLLEKIQRMGHWRVNIRPTVPLARPLTLQRCKEIVAENRVSIRGWDYPHLAKRQDDQTGLERTSDFFENWCDWETQVEFWRMYRSGQFLSYNALSEDTPAGVRHYPQDKCLYVLDATYTITEFVEFARRLHTSLHTAGSRVSVTLVGSRGRYLWAGQRRIPFFDRKETQLDKIELERTITPRDWEAGAVEVALDLLLELFELFGWNPEPAQIRADQDRFFRREFT